MPAASAGATYNDSNILPDIISKLPADLFDPAREKLVSVAFNCSATSYLSMFGFGGFLTDAPRDLSLVDATGSRTYIFSKEWDNSGVAVRENACSALSIAASSSASGTPTLLFDGQIRGVPVIAAAAAKLWASGLALLGINLPLPAFLNLCVASFVKRARATGAYNFLFTFVDETVSGNFIRSVGNDGISINTSPGASEGGQNPLGNPAPGYGTSAGTSNNAIDYDPSKDVSFDKVVSSLAFSFDFMTTPATQTISCSITVTVTTTPSSPATPSKNLGTATANFSGTGSGVGYTWFSTSLSIPLTDVAVGDTPHVQFTISGIPNEGLHIDNVKGVFS